MGRTNDSVVISPNAATADGKRTMKVVNWFEPQYTTLIIQQFLMNDHIVSKIPTGLSHL